MFELAHPTPLVELPTRYKESKNIFVFIKREDLTDELISGNKWRKLKYNFIQAKKDGFERILTFGGAYSNHIAATSAAAKRYGMTSIGIIRGDELNPDSNSTLRKAHKNGMNLIFVDRGKYKKRNDTEWLEELQKKHKAFIIPEGGSNHLACEGIVEMVKEIDQPYDYIICPVGSGGTLAGIASCLPIEKQAIGIAVLKGESYLEKTVNSLLKEKKNNWTINHRYHFGGYAKANEKLWKFKNEFEQKYNIELDQIYTCKMMYGLFEMLENNAFPPSSKIIAIHTGGLQGNSE